MSKITASTDLSQVTPQDLPRFADIFAKDVAQVINGNLDFTTNFVCAFVNITFGVIDTNTAVSHPLGFVPNGYIRVSGTANSVIYDGTLANTNTQLILRCSALGTARLLVF